MAIDQSQLLQMLLQGGGGGGAPQPTSGLQTPSLSGLALGPQGMGFGGGESLMGGGHTGFGGGAGFGGGGLDISQLLAQLQAAPGVTGAGITSPIGVGGIGGGGFTGGRFGEEGFGAGGTLGPAMGMGAIPTSVQQGQAGLGSAGTAAQFLGLLKEGTSLGKALTQLFPKGAEASQVSDINSILSEMGIAGTPFIPTASVVSGASGGSVPNLPFDPSQTLPFQIDPSILSGASGGGFVAGGAPLTGAELSAKLGAQGLGDIPSIGAPTAGAPTGLLDSLGGLQGVLGGAGVLSNLGFGALNLAQGNTGAGVGGLLGTGAGLGLGAALAPDTAGLSLLLGGLGGGVGGFFGGGGGGLFGGANPRDAQRKAAEVNRNVTAAFPALQNDLQVAQTQGDVQQAIDNFTFRVADTGFGLGFGGPSRAGILPSPPGGRFNPLVSQFQPFITQLLQRLPGGPASRVSDFGKAILGERTAARQAQAAQQLSDVNKQTGIPPSLLTQILASGGSIAGADTSDPAVWSGLGRVFGPGFGEGGG